MQPRQHSYIHSTPHYRLCLDFFGLQTALLGMVYTATLGYALITCGIYTYEWVKHSDEEFSEFSVYPEYVGLMFVGSFIAFLFWVSSLGKRLT